MCVGYQAGRWQRDSGEWKDKQKQQKLRKVRAPEKVITIGQIESRTPGFLGVLRGVIIKTRYTSATVFVDRFSGFTYVNLQTSTNTDEILKVKSFFQVYAESLSVKILHYHTNNGRFVDKKSMRAIETEWQTTCFAVLICIWRYRYYFSGNSISNPIIHSTQPHPFAKNPNRLHRLNHHSDEIKGSD